MPRTERLLRLSMGVMKISPLKSVEPSLRTVATYGVQVAWGAGVCQRSVRVRVTGMSVAACAGLPKASRSAQAAKTGATARAILMFPSTHGNGGYATPVTPTLLAHPAGYHQPTVMLLTS